MIDPNNLPEGHRAVPLLLTVSQGGQYEDHAFAAGFQVGMVYHAMTLLRHPADRLPARVPTVLVRQLDLMAMSMELVTDVQGIEGHPEWMDLTFRMAAA